MNNKFAELNENKVEKSIRNSKEFKEALERAMKGEFDKDIDSAKGLNFLKVYENWTIRKMFSLERGEDYYKLYKEVFYVENPGKYYFDTVNPTIYRRIAGQHEEGDKKWANAVAKHLGIKIVDDSKAEEPATEEESSNN